MFEMIALSMMLFLFAASFYSSLPGNLRFFARSKTAKSAGKTIVTSESYSFLNYLKTEIEAELFPRPTDSVLKRHYDTLVAVEVKNRLSMMSE